jgi:hypothetical protein
LFGVSASDVGIVELDRYRRDWKHFLWRMNWYGKQGT